MSVNARWTAVGIAIALCAGLPPADATTWYVAPPPAGSDAHNGTDGWAQAFATITNAVTNAVTLDTIRLASGDYPIQSEIGVDKGVTIVGEGGRDNTFVFRTGSQSTRIFRINHSNAVLDGLTISNGLLNAAPGAGIYLLKGTVRNCLITRNAGDNGNSASGIGVSVIMIGL